MELPSSLRETLVDELDDYIEALADHPSAEHVAAYLAEQLEVWAEDEGMDDVLADIEEEAALDGSFTEIFEAEMESNEEFEWTGEEVVSLFERVCEIEWEDDEGEEEDEDEDEDEDF